MLGTLLLVSMGIWLVIAPASLGFVGTMAEMYSITTGAIIAGSATLLLWPRLDVLRWFTFALGLTLTTSPAWMLGEDPTALVNQLITGLLVMAFSLLVNQRVRDTHPTRTVTSFRYPLKKSLSK